MPKILIIVTLSILFAHTCYSQKKIKLTNNKTHKVLILKQGMRVSYILQNDVVKKGILKIVDETFCIIEDESVNYRDLGSIGRKRSGSGFFQVFCGIIGGGAIGSSLFPAPTPQCQGCQQVQSSVDTGAVAAGVLAGATFIALGVNSGIRNSSKDIVHKWKLEVIE